MFFIVKTLCYTYDQRILFCRQVLSHVRTIPELILLGCSSQNVKRLPTFSFMVRHPRGTYLHHNFVCAILNDVFGVQARGGCACAGRYAHNLMGIDDQLAKNYENILLLKYVIRTRLYRYILICTLLEICL